MWIIRGIANVMSSTIFTAKEDIIGSACDIDGVDEAVFAESIGKVPEGFFVVGSNVVE